MTHLVDLEGVASIMQWHTPSDKEKWCARLLGGQFFYRGMTPAEAVANARAGVVKARCGVGAPGSDQVGEQVDENADLFG